MASTRRGYVVRQTVVEAKECRPAPKTIPVLSFIAPTGDAVNGASTVVRGHRLTLRQGYGGALST